jgi:hypothetical protein
MSALQKLIDKDEKTLKLLCKEAKSSAWFGMGKRVEIPYIELISLIELARKHPEEYIMIREVIAAPRA